jgi:uncharacterized protein
MKKLNKKIERVKEQLRSLGKGKVAVAFSGGKDSFFLLKLAVETLGKEHVLAFFVRTGFSTQNDEKRVDYFANLFDFNLERKNIDIRDEWEIMENKKERCYFCKKKIFNTLKSEASILGIDTVLDGSTHSDLGEYRPGLKAIKELHIISPLQEAKITSAEIVTFLKERLHVEDYYLTSSTCLATRFPYNFTLDEKILRTFDKVEAYFVGQGIYPVKIRFIEDGIRIETSENNFARIFEIKEKILEFCKKQGLKFITLDIEGIKTGVWD